MEMTATVIIEKQTSEKAYAVYVGGDVDDDSWDRLFHWGTLDDGDVPWQRARADAFKYAKKVAEKLGGTAERW